MPESYSQYYTKNLLSFVATIQLIYILIFQKSPPFPAFVLPSNIGFQTHTRKNRPAVLTYIDPMIYVSSSPILHIGIWVGQKYRYSQYNFSFFQTNPVLSFLSADYPPFSKRKNSLSKLMLIFRLLHIISFSLSISYKSSIQIFVLTICITLADVSIRDTIPFFCRYSPLKKNTAVTTSFFLICRSFRSSSSWYSSGSSILGTTIFSFFEALLDNLLKQQMA